MTELTSKDTGLFFRMAEVAERIVTVSHTHPDGDAVGSSLALAGWLSAKGKKVASVFPDPVPSSLSFISTGEKILIYSSDPAEVETAVREADLIICLDFNAFRRTEGVAPSLASAKGRKVLIDHHINPDRESFDLCFSETDISSASELLFWILMAMPGIDGDASKLPTSSAKALMTGMTTDTNNFSNSVYPSTLEMASMLLAAGVDRDEILDQLFQNYRENRLRLLGHILKDLLVITPQGAAYFIVDEAVREAYDIFDGETEGFVNLPLGLAAVRMSIFLRQEKDHFRVSIRSKRGTSANEFAIKYFSGGGHENAAGGKLFLKDGSTSAASYVENAIKEYFK